MQSSPYLKNLILISLSVFVCTTSQAQQLLNKQVTLHVTKQPLQNVLEQIGTQCGFHFSYNSNFINGDSLVSLSVKKQTVKQTMDLLFHGTLQYKETEGLIILKYAEARQSWYISGYISDGLSGERLNNVSIYEREHLAGTITDNKGYFRLQLKEKNRYPPVITISISCVSYEDTSFQVYAGYNQEVELAVNPSKKQLATLVVTPRVQRSGLGMLLISSRLKKQTANLRNFLATKPVQFSLTPRLGTHGELGARVINKFSFNLLGGYTAGVNGFELGGLFNITQNNVNKMQVGGLFNVVGGNVNGLQVAGIHNKVLDSVKGMQVGGLFNVVGGNVKGFQVGGIMNVVRKSASGFQVGGLFNEVKGSVNGMQVAGLVNITGGDVSGFQVSGITSITRETVKGTQISGLLNYTRNLKGWQIGFINYADTSTGYSIGVINVNHKGYHHFSASASELLDVALAYKAGNRNFYTILLLGANVVRKKAYAVGYGLGNEVMVGSKFSITNELITTGYYTGSWNTMPITTSFRSSLNVRINKHFAVHGGPAISVGEVKPAPGKGYAAVMPAHTAFNIGKSWKGWIGWQLGITL